MILFLGRSNVGKSSLLNRLLGTRSLARTSSAPGRTQSVNFYRVNEAVWFVDLPGYGYARVPEAVRRRWKPLVEGFLERRRKQVALAVLLVDARHEPTELDRVMQRWLEDREVPYVVAATKSDKLSRGARARRERDLAASLGESNLEVPPVWISARTGEGIRELWRHLEERIKAFRSTPQANRAVRRPGA